MTINIKIIPLMAILVIPTVYALYRKTALAELYNLSGGNMLKWRNFSMIWSPNEEHHPTRQGDQ
jgi:hypothetical protein